MIPKVRFCYIARQSLRGSHERLQDLVPMKPVPRPDWNAHLAGVALGLTLLATFIFTGHGLGASGFATALAAKAAYVAAPVAASANSYLGPMVEGGRNPLNSWITWQVLGVAFGALAASLIGGRFRWRLDGPLRLSSLPRVLFAVGGGTLAGFGARISAGCTSGLGLSGSATLAVAGFVFLMGFFAFGLVGGFMLRRFWR
jgi:hypothetical protein